MPRDLDEVARGFRLTGWQKFWQLEAPFAVPGLIWNTMMSMSGGWFFVVAAEAITVGDTTITLPGVGSYISAANNAGRWDAIFAAVVTMAIVILLYDQLLFRPIIAWAGEVPRRAVGWSRSKPPGCSTFCGGRIGYGWALSRSSRRCAR